MSFITFRAFKLRQLIANDVFLTAVCKAQSSKENEIVGTQLY